MSRPRDHRARDRAPRPNHFPRCKPRGFAALAGLALMTMAVMGLFVMAMAGQARAVSAPPAASTSSYDLMPDDLFQDELIPGELIPGKLIPGIAALDQMLNAAEVRAVGHGQFPKWTEVLGRSAIAGESAWTGRLARLRGRDRRAQIEAVNRMVNLAPYRLDAVNYGQSDYWATPDELFTRGGDCEDYAFAKFQALRILGFANRDLRLVVVHDIARGMPHAVLAVDLGAETLILDSQFNTIFAAARLKRYLPYYSVNEDGGWTHIASWTTPRTITAQTDTAQTGTIKVNSTGSLVPASARR